MVVLTLCAILLVLAAPSFQALVDRMRIDTTTRELLAALALTRASAIARSERVDLMPLNRRDWTSGWIIFIDTNQNHQYDPGEKILYSHAAVAPRITIKSAMHDNAMPYVAYMASGRTRINANGQVPQVGHIELRLGTQRRRVVLNFIGRARSCNPDADNYCG